MCERFAAVDRAHGDVAPARASRSPCAGSPWPRTAVVCACVSDAALVYIAVCRAGVVHARVAVCDPRRASGKR